MTFTWATVVDNATTNDKKELILFVNRSASSCDINIADGNRADGRSGGTNGIVIGVGALLSLIAILTIVGNLIVVASVGRHLTTRKGTGGGGAMRTWRISIWFIGSLAVADSLVGSAIMPVALAQDLTGRWPFHAALCPLWLATDVLLSSASIFNLCLLSLDRYLAIQESIRYPQLVTSRRARLAISFVWMVAAAIAAFPFLLSDLTLHPESAVNDDVCQTVFNLPYSLASSAISFYIPATVMTSVYSKVYAIAKKQAKAIAHLEKHIQSLQCQSTQDLRCNSRCSELSTPSHLSVHAVAAGKDCGHDSTKKLCALNTSSGINTPILNRSTSPGKNLCPVSPLKVPKPISPHQNTCSISPHQNTCSISPHKDLCSYSPHKDLCSYSPHKDLCSYSPHKDLCSYSPHKDLLSIGHPNDDFAVRHNGDVLANHVDINDFEEKRKSLGRHGDGESGKERGRESASEVTDEEREREYEDREGDKDWDRNREGEKAKEGESEKEREGGKDRDRDPKDETVTDGERERKAETKENLEKVINEKRFREIEKRTGVGNEEEEGEGEEERDGDEDGERVAEKNESRDGKINVNENDRVFHPNDDPSPETKCSRYLETGASPRPLDADVASVASRNPSQTFVTVTRSSTVTDIVKKVKRKKAKDAVSEQRAIKTVGLVMGVFVGCWLPFFLLNSVLPWDPRFFLCLRGFDLVFQILTWLGWINSLFNPMIYACNKSFRKALFPTWNRRSEARERREELAERLNCIGSKRHSNRNNGDGIEDGIRYGIRDGVENGFKDGIV